MTEPDKQQAQGTPPGKPEHGGHLLDEADIGSGEKTPGEIETEEDIKSIPPLPHGSGKRDLKS